MHRDSITIILENIDKIADNTTTWIKENYPDRTNDTNKCTRDIKHVLQTLLTAIENEDIAVMEKFARMFYQDGVIQLKSLHVEFDAYNYLLKQINNLVENQDFIIACEKHLQILKNKMSSGVPKVDSEFSTVENGFDYHKPERDYIIKHQFYRWDNEMDIIKRMQKCQRNWDYSKKIHPEIIDYLLWHAENAPSKQWDAYYDVYWSADRKVIDEITKYTWGSTHCRTPPSTWRNTQSNANMYMLFVAKEPETQLNCHADGTLKSNKDPARWENAYVSIGIAMSLVMRAANALGLATGCNKSHGDFNGDDFWEKRLGILDDVKNGRKRIAYGIGIGYPQEGRARWETDDYELAIGAGNGSNLTDKEDMNVHPRTGKKMRKVKIVDIRTCDYAVDPQGITHEIPNTSEIKINTIRKRIINITKIK